MNKFKVLFLTPLPPPLHGVSFLNGHLLASDILKDGFDLDVVKLNPTQGESKRGLEGIGRFGFTKLVAGLRLILQVFILNLKTRYDLIYIPVSTFGPAMYRDILIILMAKYLFRRKLLVHVRGREFNLYQGQRWKGLLLKIAFDKTNIIQHTSRNSGDLDWFLNDCSNRFFVPNGVPDLFFDRDVSDRVEVSGPLKLLFLSNLMLRKGPLRVLEAMSIIRKQNIDVQCTFAGSWTDDIPESLFKNKVSELELEEFVYILGPVEGKVKNDLFWDNNIFVFPTYNESFGNVVVEALSAGMPVVSSNYGSIADMVEEGVTGSLVDPFDIDALADAILRVADMISDSGRVSDSCRATYMEKYTLNVFEKSIVELFYKVCRD